MDPASARPATSFRIQLNGSPREVEDGLDVAGLLRAEGLPERGLAVERNGRVVPRAEHAGHRLQAGDVIEIVQLVGGG